MLPRKKGDHPIGLTKIDGENYDGHPLDCGVPKIVTHMEKTVVTTWTNL